MNKMKHGYLLLLFLILIGFGAVVFFLRKSDCERHDYPLPVCQQKDSIRLQNSTLAATPPILKTYSNKKLGLAFEYPPTWTVTGKEVEVLDLSGNLLAIEINFEDTSSQTSLLIAHHFGPKGMELYQYAASQFAESKGWFENGGKKIEVGGDTALKAVNIIYRDGKGNKLEPPTVSIIVVFPDKIQTGEIEMQFKTKASDSDIETSKFDNLLSSFRFLL